MGIVVLVGCEALGRYARREPERSALSPQARTLLKLADDQQRVWKVGAALLQHLPSEEHDGAYPDIGLTVYQIDQVAREAWGYPENEEGLAVIVVRPNGPAAKTGVQRGDILREINDRTVPTPKAFREFVQQLSPAKELTVVIDRRGRSRHLRLFVGSMPRHVEFSIWNRPEVLSWMTPEGDLGFTSAMVENLETDDQLAVMLGHELAHLTAGHGTKGTAVATSTQALASLVGSATDLAAPGMGSMVSAVVPPIVGGTYSRRLEREADYKGLVYAYRAGYDVVSGVSVWRRHAEQLPATEMYSVLSTHPTSLERLIRAQIIAESLQREGLEATLDRYQFRTREVLIEESAFADH